MLQRRDADGFNLAFLDVMACGLGAVILIFMLVKFNASTPEPVEEEKRLKAELAELEAQQENLQSSIGSVNAQKKAQGARLETLKSEIETLKQQNSQASTAKKDKQAVLADLEQAVAAVAPKQTEDTIKLKGKGEERYLLGLKVEGSQIGILVDSSASMTDETLMDIISRKISSNKQKKKAAKWRRTKRVARWLLARIPSSSRVSMVAFNDKAKNVGPKKVRGNDKSGLKKISRAIDKLVPEEGTNLQTALKAIKRANPGLNSLYVITDGLPTLGDKGSGLSAFRKCGSFFGKSSTITGDCRMQLFAHSVQQAGLTGVKVNVVLLPLEGDPGAAAAYWGWSASTKGLFISPAGSWP